MNIGGIKHVTFEIAAEANNQQGTQTKEVDMLIKGLFVGKVGLTEKKGGDGVGFKMVLK